MSLQVEKRENGMALFTVTVPAQELEVAMEKAYQKLRGRLSAPGFRKGKIPRPVAEKLYGKEFFYEEAANILIPDAFAEAIKECDEVIVSAPSYEIVYIEDGEPFVFSAEAALKPEVKLGKYKGVSIPKLSDTVTKEEIEEALLKEQEKNARHVAVSDRAVMDGDMTVIDFLGTIDDVPFEGGSGEDVSLTIGSGSFIPGFEEQLIGTLVDGEKDVKVTFPDDYNAKELAGKEAVFKCVVKEIKIKELPELDDEFAAEVSEFETLSEFREDLEEQLLEKKIENNKETRGNSAIEAVIANAEMEIPPPMITEFVREIVEEFSEQAKSYGITPHVYLQILGMTEEMYFEHAEKQAEMRIRASLALEAVALAEGITADEEDVEEELKDYLTESRSDTESAREYMEERRDEFERRIRIKKAMKFVVANAKEKK